MKFLQRPGLSLVLLVTWLALNNSLAPGQILLGALLAMAIPALLPNLNLPVDPPRRPWVAVRLLLVVLLDIVVANLQVAKRILGPESRLRPAFVTVPLEIRHPWGIAALAGIITMTPGTVSTEVSPDQRSLLVHALDLDGEAGLVASIKARYETPLRQIFGEGGP